MVQHEEFIFELLTAKILLSLISIFFELDLTESLYHACFQKHTLKVVGL